MRAIPKESRDASPPLLTDSNLWLVLAFSVFAWTPLLTPAYFFDAHDAKHSVFFLVEFDQTLRDGYWWPRWSPDFSFGYGYPLFNLYAPLSFYAAELLHLAGLGMTAAIKAVYILATIFAGIGMFLFGRRLYGSMAGLLAAVVFMYVPFHLVEIYVRSAYAEFVSLAIIPFLFLAFTNLVAHPSLRRVAVAGLLYGLLALTHHTSFFTFTPFLMIYILYLLVSVTVARQRTDSHRSLSEASRLLINRSLYAVGAGLLGIALAAIYLIPVIAETRYIKVEQWTSGSYNYLQHFVYFSQFFEEAWGYGYAGAGLQDDFSYQLGAIVVLLITFAGVMSLYRRYSHRHTAFFFMIATLVTILLMSPLAEPVWQVIPIASLVQFPWRLLAVTAFTMSIVAGSLLAALGADTADTIESDPLAAVNEHRSPVYLLTLVVILGSFAYTLPQYTEIPPWAETPLAVISWDRASIADRVGMVSVTDEQPRTSPMEQQYLNNEPLVTTGISSGQGTVDMVHHGGASDEVRVSVDEPVTLQFYTYDYPGWQVTLNDQPVPHRPEPPFGLITVDLPAGEHVVSLRMGSTPPRVLGTVISLLALVAITGLLIYPARRN